VNPPDPEALLSILLDEHPRGVPRGAFPEALWSTLERRGYDLQHDATSSRLESNQWFHPRRFQQRRRGRLGARVHAWGVTTSTNSLARDADDDTAVPGTVWVADEQTAGRGRQGRSWLAPRHLGLLFSLHLPVDLRHADHPQWLPLALGVGLCETLESLSGLPVLMKWPNDLVSDRRKLGGLIVEAAGAPVPRTILGAGINVGLDAAALRALGVPDAMGLRDAPQCATACRQAGFREELLADLLQAIETWIDRWRRDDVVELLDAWRRRDALHGARVRAVTAGHSIEGEARGIDEQGRLQVIDAQATMHRFTSVEVHLL
jgi:BirA family biotin operon repressor/biotin-[acetyl-CoA-carboxylase] ligase